MTDSIAHENSAGEPDNVSEMLQLVGFRVETEEYCLHIQLVQEIIRFLPLTRVPNSRGFVEGVMNLRGKIVPVVALRKSFGLAAAVPTKDSRIVVAQARAAVLGFMVDSVSEVLRIPANKIEPPPRIGAGEREYVSGVAKVGDRLLMVLDLDRLLSEAEGQAISAITRGRGAGAA